ncbi:MAG: TIGR04211 family SH3 domain-containing protein [Pseudomonadota bacterium]
MLSSAVAAQEETAYVTDVLRLGLHAAADTSDRAFRMLQSGQSMTVVERTRLYAKVRLPDGTEGYVKAAYLVDEKPARLIVDQAQAQLASVQQEMNVMQDEFSGSATRISELTDQLADERSQRVALSERINAMTTENSDYAQKLQLYSASLPWPLALGATLVALALGFAGGVWWIDSRSRKRHGGFRIY